MVGDVRPEHMDRSEFDRQSDDLLEKEGIKIRASTFLLPELLV